MLCQDGFCPAFTGTLLKVHNGPGGVNILGLWRCELRQVPKQAFVGNGHPRDEELNKLRLELVWVTKEREFFARSGSVLRESVEVKFWMIQRCPARFLSD
jgi:hypothetical protein